MKPRVVNRPTPGRYLLAMTRGAWPVPATIRLVDGQYSAEVDGRPLDGLWNEADIEEQLFEWLTGEPSHPFLRLVLYGRACDEATFLHRTAMREWALQHRPRHPAANPLLRMDPSELAAEDF